MKTPPVASFELSKELAKYVKLETYFYWVRYGRSWWEIVAGNYSELSQLWETYPAPLSCELGEVLPCWIYTTKDEDSTFYCWSDGDNGAPEDLYEGIQPIYANTEANARVEMLIYLYEKGILPVEEIV